MPRYQVVEKFVSINGEGTRTGQLAVFIRFQGCNLNCSFCDTNWANKKDAPYTWMTDQEIASYVHETGIRNVTLTGGEPLLQPEINCLLETLHQNTSLSVEVETNGSISLNQHRIAETFPLFTMDYKLPGSKMERKMRMENFSELKEADTVKFVVGSQTDLDKANKVIAEHDLVHICHVYLSPVFGNIVPEEIVNYMLSRNMNGVNLQLQMHKFIWDPMKRGV